MFNLLHVKWFVDYEEMTGGGEIGFEFFEKAVGICFVMTLVVLLCAFYCEKKLKVPKWLVNFGDKYRKWLLWSFQLLVALFFFFSAYENILIAPIFIVDTLIEQILMWILVGVGVLLIANLWLWLAGFLLLAVYVSVGYLYGVSTILEHAHLLGLSLFFILTGWSFKFGNFIHQLKFKAQDILRILTGVALIVLGWVEKLAYPVVGEEFLKLHNWNFIHDLLGISLMDNHFFVIAAGFVEMLFGLILVLGWVTRLNTLVLAVFFIITAIILGPHEVLGHLPIFAIAILLLVWGKTLPKSKEKI